jgi:predicted transcriptional regulator
MAETSPEKIADSEMLRMTTDVVVAYVGANALPAAQLPEVIRMVHASLAGLQGDATAPVPAAELKPAVSIRASVRPDYIVCLEDGRKFKMLKRHLRTAYDLTPDQYRQKWGLPSDYPMVAPNYANQRSEFAKKIGLGKIAARRRKK